MKSTLAKVVSHREFLRMCGLAAVGAGVASATQMVRPVPVEAFTYNENLIVNGYIGIWTASPQAYLHINGQAAITSILADKPGSSTGSVSVTSPGGVPGILLKSNTPDLFRADIRRQRDSLDFAVGATTGTPNVVLSIRNTGEVWVNNAVSIKADGVAAQSYYA